MTHRRGVIPRLFARAGEALLAAYRPLRFSKEGALEALTLAEFESLCDWESMRRSGMAGPEETPLSVAGLRTSRLFPRHLLHRAEHGRTVLLTPGQARGVVAAVMLQRAGRLYFQGDVSQGAAAASPVTSAENRSAAEGRDHALTVQHLSHS
jgi:hypothetical protein